MADWNEDAPLDNAVVSQFPANERAARAAVVTNFAVDHVGDDTDSDFGQHSQVTLPERSSDPTTDTNTGFLYTKDVSGTTEVFYRDAAGNVVQLTTGGRTRGQVKPEVKTSSFTAVAGGCYLIDKSGGDVVVTLPASPAVGNEPIRITHIIGTSNALTIARNSKNIMGLAENLTVDDDYVSFALYWGDTSPGWRIGSIV